MGEEVMEQINRLIDGISELDALNQEFTDEQREQRSKLIFEIKTALTEIQCQMSKVDSLEKNLGENVQSINQQFQLLDDHIKKDEQTKEEIRRMQITSEMHSAQIQEINGELTEVKKVINEISDKFDLLTDNTTVLYTKTQEQIQSINTTIYEHIQNIVELTSSYEEQVNKIKDQMYQFMFDDFMPQFSQKFLDVIANKINLASQYEVRQQEIKLERKTVDWNAIITQILVSLFTTGGVVQLILHMLAK